MISNHLKTLCNAVHRKLHEKCMSDHTRLVTKTNILQGDLVNLRDQYKELERKFANTMSLLDSKERETMDLARQLFQVKAKAAQYREERDALAFVKHCGREHCNCRVDDNQGEG